MHIIGYKSVLLGTNFEEHVGNFELFINVTILLKVFVYTMYIYAVNKTIIKHETLNFTL